MTAPATPMVEAGVAAAGFAVARLLSAPPNAPTLERFSVRGDRQSWPIDNESSGRALELMADGFDVAAVRTEWVRLLGDGPETVELRESGWRGLDPDVLGRELDECYGRVGLTATHLGGPPSDHLGAELAYLAHLTAALARTVGDDDAEATVVTARRILGFRGEHVDHFGAAALAALGDRARTPVIRALPGLAHGVLEALDQLVGTRLGPDRRGRR